MTEESRPTLINAWSRSATRAPSEPVRHKLIDVLVIAVCATICGAEAWTEMEEFGKAKEEWLRTFLELPNGIPSHDTFRRVFMRIKPSEFQRSFLLWVKEIAMMVKAELVCGNVYINRSCTGAVVGRHPFGGFKMSGGGTKAGGSDYLLNFLVPRVVTENIMRHGFAPESTPQYRAEFTSGRPNGALIQPS